jgi:hypothetical protein
MRLRFSLRLIFVVTTLSAIALYWFVVRPGRLADRFVSAVNGRDYETARRMLPDFWLFKADAVEHTVPIDLVYAEVLPAEWADYRCCQRRIILRVGRHNDSGGAHIEWTEDTDVVACPHRLKITRPTCLPAFRWFPNEIPTQPAITNPGEGLNLEQRMRTG